MANKLLTQRKLKKRYSASKGRLFKFRTKRYQPQYEHVHESCINNLNWSLKYRQKFFRDIVEGRCTSDDFLHHENKIVCRRLARNVLMLMKKDSHSTGPTCESRAFDGIQLNGQVPDRRPVVFMLATPNQSY
ncbi:hypothetical protein TNIN_220101 [Trichonephila inaurata madagascariensis]|uniref:Uncharacterized protein n=1 Tax=Trichonephila inaurata madagascariensis TaxID=2747483 RepID=A0A8X7C995_9ARAC|nr:hypothetical protein TNIN_220101 [Trichonephila inaurata madagascariensis]